MEKKNKTERLCWKHLNYEDMHHENVLFYIEDNIKD